MAVWAAEHHAAPSPSLHRLLDVFPVDGAVVFVMWAGLVGMGSWFPLPRPPLMLLTTFFGAVLVVRAGTVAAIAAADADVSSHRLVLIVLLFLTSQYFNIPHLFQESPYSSRPLFPRVLFF